LQRLSPEAMASKSPPGESWSPAQAARRGDSAVSVLQLLPEQRNTYPFDRFK
jgi:hypothetical protein